MNKLFIIFLLIFNTGHSYAQNKSCFSKTNSSKYFFINGIKNKLREAETSASLIEIKFNKKLVTPIYNKSISLIQDIKETFFLKGIDIKRKERNIIKKELMERPEIYQDISSYLDQLEEKKQNYIFAHSEGNLFANHMCELKDEDLKMDVISFATPSDYLKCNLNEKYALFKEDSVISWGNFKAPFFKKIEPNYNSDKNIIYKDEKEEFSLNFSNHSLSLYLSNEKAVKDLKEKLEKTESEIYKKDYSFNIAEIEIKEDNKLESLLNQANDAKESLELWGREKQAFLNVVSYSTELAGNIQKKGFIKKILDAEIPAQDEQEFADMIAYSLNSLNSYCNSVFPPNLRPLCNKVGVKNYFKNQENIEPYLSYNKHEDWKMMLPCNIAADSVGVKMPITLTFQKRLPTVLYNYEKLEINYESDSTKITSFQIGEINIQEKDSIIEAIWTPATIKQSNQTLAADKMAQCNSLSKLASKPCNSFLKHIESKYFSKN